MSVDLLAILWGVFAGLALSLLVGVVLAVAWGVDLARRFGDDDDISDAAFAWQWAEAVSEVPFTIGLVIISLLVSVIAGYVTARLAGQAPYLNAGITGAIITVVGYLMERRDPVLPRKFSIAALAATVPAHLLGAWLQVG